MKSIESKELIIAIEELEKERGINKEYLLESLETALVTAYKRNFDAAENVKVIIDAETGDIKVFSLKQVVEEVEDDMLEISLEEALKKDKKVNVGDTLQIEIIPRDFGRIAAQTAKQVIVQKVREAERNMIFTEYSDRKGEIVSGIIQKSEGGAVVLDLGKLEGVKVIVSSAVVLSPLIDIAIFLAPAFSFVISVVSKLQTTQSPTPSIVILVTLTAP